MAITDLDDEIDKLIKKKGMGEKDRHLVEDDELDDDELDDDEVDDEEEVKFEGTWTELAEQPAIQEKLNDMKVLGYVAGFLAGTGSFAVAGASIRLTVRSTKNLDAVRVFADRASAALKINVRVAEGLYGPKNNLKNGVMVQLSGKPLHKLMTYVWDLMPDDRKLEYARARKKARIYAESV